MHSCMNDGAHDEQHIYRVLYAALDIASDYQIDIDVLIAAALLHDIGREAQFKDPKLDHAVVGADMAYHFLKHHGWSENKAGHVRDCIRTHRYRNDRPPETLEAKILYDADKLDATGTMGIARTLAYKGIVCDPLYSLDDSGSVRDGTDEDTCSFFHEYNFKLKNLYDTFFTAKAYQIAQKRRKAGADFYHSMLREVEQVHKVGRQILEVHFQE